jgi:hypothetical protein
VNDDGDDDPSSEGVVPVPAGDVRLNGDPQVHARFVRPIDDQVHMPGMPPALATEITAALERFGLSTFTGQPPTPLPRSRQSMLEAVRSVVPRLDSGQTGALAHSERAQLRRLTEVIGLLVAVTLSPNVYGEAEGAAMASIYFEAALLQLVDLAQGIMFNQNSVLSGQQSAGAKTWVVSHGGMFRPSISERK